MNLVRSLLPLFFLFAALRPSLGQHVPVVQQVDRNLIPKVETLVAVSPGNPSQYPLIAYKGRAYVAYSHVDKRNAMTIVAFDKGDRIVSRWEKKGAKNLRGITVNQKRKTVTFWGQGKKAIRMSWKQLETFQLPLAQKSSPSTKSIAHHMRDMPTFDDLDLGPLGQLPGMKRELEKMQQEMQWQAEQTAEEAAELRREVSRRLNKRVTFDKEEAESLLMEIISLDMLSAVAGLGEGFAGGDGAEEKIISSLKSSHKLLLKLRAKVASELFIGTDVERRELLKQIDEVIKLHREQIQ